MGRVAVLVALLFSIAGCSQDPRWRVTWGGGSASKVVPRNPFITCDLFAAFRNGDAVIAEGDAPSLPAEGALLNGDMTGFGSRHVTNESNNHSFDVQVVYHTSSFQAIMTELRRRGCAR
jgi:hypothetical protein